LTILDLDFQFSGEQLKALAVLEERINGLRQKLVERNHIHAEFFYNKNQPDVADVFGRFRPVYGPTLIGIVLNFS